MEHVSRASLTSQSTRQAEVLPASADTLKWGLPATLVWGQQVKHFQMAFKRILDLVIALVTLGMLAIPMALLAVVIKLDSRGPIFFTQARVGHSGKIFRMYKFRSMVVNSESAKQGLLFQNETDGPLFKMRRDPRRTRVGQMIRRFSIDELPQLLNVILGHMSLVGPRPALPEEANQYDTYDAQRVLAVPGITGLWQVSGRSLLGFDEMVQLDIRYATDWSLWLDLKILLRTPSVIISGKGAY